MSIAPISNVTAACTRPKVKDTLAALVFLASFALLYRDVVAKLVRDWYIDENYSHGFLIIPLALYLLWERRARLAAAVPRPSMGGIALIIFSLLVLLAGMLGSELFLTRISLLGVLAGAVLFIQGWHHFKILAFPILFLGLMIPLPAIIFNQVAFPLQLLASRFGESALILAGIPVLREGNVIQLANTSLEVAEACSGIRSLISLLTLGIIYGYFITSRISARVALALATIPIAILANGIRVAGTGIAANYYGPEAAQGFFHSFSGWLLFLVAFILLFIAERLIRWILPPRLLPAESAKVADQGIQEEECSVEP